MPDILKNAKHIWEFKEFVQYIKYKFKENIV